jgi:serine/threonine protein phosphatase PrpC
MKPYKLIKDAHKVCKDLEYNLQYSKNRARDTKRINTILRALKGFDDMLVYKYKVNEIDKLICYIIEDFIIKFTAQGKNKIDLDLYQIVNKIQMCILDENYNAISNLASEITSYQIGKIAINGDYEKLNLPDKKKTITLVKKLLIDLKMDMQWTLQK